MHTSPTAGGQHQQRSAARSLLWPSSKNGIHLVLSYKNRNYQHDSDQQSRKRETSSRTQDSSIKAERGILKVFLVKWTVEVDKGCTSWMKCKEWQRFYCSLRVRRLPSQFEPRPWATRWDLYGPLPTCYVVATENFSPLEMETYSAATKYFASTAAPVDGKETKPPKQDSENFF
ncbi:hypothetical protein AVEN_131066-1 [Araneus ventricosus]|uniref:Uncharacterized protein n=1 Tax=Araneus ventricosus TaxID=182803 RepID=A0A4Y2D2I1_ARAVE|nr:hypothetical protein AVEN_131066-1 [Araneus ventricosus]